MSKKKLSLRALVLMVFTSVFGFTNVTRSYYLMWDTQLFLGLLYLV